MKIFQTDYYQFTMSLAYLVSGKANEITGFESFFRHIKKEVNPFTDFYIFSGQEELVRFIESVKQEIQDPNFFDSFWDIVKKTIPEDRQKEIYTIAKSEFEKVDKFFEYTVLPEGSKVFPYIPIFQYRGPKIFGQMIETKVTNIVNGQTGFRTFNMFGKENILKDIADIVYPIGDIPSWYKEDLRIKAKEYRNSTSKILFEAAYRRAPGQKAADIATQIAIEEGWNGTSNVSAYMKDFVSIDQVGGTMAHAFVMSFEEEIDAFRAWNDIYPKSTILVDTYDTINAVNTLIENDIRPASVRIDSGDLKEMSFKVREILDNAGWTEVKIFISGDITPEILKEFEEENVPFDITMAGTKYVNEKEISHINAGFVYKIVEYEKNGKRIFPIKKAEGKSNYPGLKSVHFFGDRITVDIENEFGFYGNSMDTKETATVSFQI
jgi:nicotinate phosphoribosyltransferase